MPNFILLAQLSYQNFNELLMKKILRLLDKLSFTKLAFVFSLTLLLLSLLFSAIYFLLDVDVMVNTEFENLTTTKLLLLAVFFAPIIESLIYQYGIIELGLFVRVKLDSIPIPSYMPGLMSAVLFGISHQYNWNYVLITSLMGLCLASVYYYTRKRFGVSLAFVMCVIVHGVNNLVAFLGQILS